MYTFSITTSTCSSLLIKKAVENYIGESCSIESGYTTDTKMTHFITFKKSIEFKGFIPIIYKHHTFIAIPVN